MKSLSKMARLLPAPGALAAGAAHAVNDITDCP